MDQVIREIAERLGIEAARVWPQVIAVTWITSLFWVIVDPILIAIAITITAKAWKRVFIEQAKSKKEAEARRAAGGYFSTLDMSCDLWIAGAFVLSLCALFVILACLLGFPDNLAGLIYPEATTILHLAKVK